MCVYIYIHNNTYVYIYIYIYIHTYIHTQYHLISLQGAGGRESPAGAALALVLRGRHGAALRPVHGLRERPAAVQVGAEVRRAAVELRPNNTTNSTNNNTHNDNNDSTVIIL